MTSNVTTTGDLSNATVEEAAALPDNSALDSSSVTGLLTCVSASHYFLYLHRVTWSVI